MNTKCEYIDEENEKKVKAQLDFIEAIIEEEDFLTEKELDVNKELKDYYERKIKSLKKEIENEKLKSIKNKLKALKKQYETGLKTLN